MKPTVVAIAGGSGSGKTSFVKELQKCLNKANISNTVVSIDNFYIPPPKNCIIENYDFDNPDAIDFNLLMNSISNLINNSDTIIPEYDFASHDRINSYSVSPTDVIIIEGIMALCYEPLLNIIDIKIFIDLDIDIALARRILRDTKERSRTVESIILQYTKFVKNGFESYVKPSRNKANLIIPNNNNFDTACDTIATFIIKSVKYDKSCNN